MMQVFVMLRDRTVRELTEEEVGRLPDFVVETLEVGCLAVSSYTGETLMYGNSEEHLTKDENG